MMIKGKEYIYKHNGSRVRGVFLRSTPAWNIFLRGSAEDWIPSYLPVFDTEEAADIVESIVRGIEKSVHVPDIVHIPNYYTK